MSFEPTWLFLSLIPGGVGFVLFVYGKKQERWPHLAAGLAFMIYPYFATSVASLVVAGVALGVALWLAVRAGW
jgi:hypothetical protein